MDLGQSKFDIGQHVWLIKTTRTSKYAPCRKCGGEYKKEVVWADGSKSTVECACHGIRGNLSSPTSIIKQTILYLAGTVTGIELSIPGCWGLRDQKEREMIYRLKRDPEFPETPEDRTNIFRENHMFPSKEEALLYCTQPEEIPYDPNKRWDY